MQSAQSLHKTSGDPITGVALGVEEGASEDGFAVDDVWYRNLAVERLYGRYQFRDRYLYGSEVQLTSGTAS